MLGVVESMLVWAGTIIATMRHDTTTRLTPAVAVAVAVTVAAVSWSNHHSRRCC
jgi:hypothetical protein